MDDAVEIPDRDEPSNWTRIANHRMHNSRYSLRIKSEVISNV